jgi:predicted phosphodiesterase
LEQIGHWKASRLWRQNVGTAVNFRGKRFEPAEPVARATAGCCDDPRVTTAVISDLHLGALNDADMLRRSEALERLSEALAGADRVVLLGDTLELRERPVAALLGVVRPVFERLAPALAGKPVTFVPGNHDHQLGEPWLARLRLAGRPLGSENEWRVTPTDESGPAGVLASWLPRSEVTLAYPGVRLEDGSYATHGQYLDLYLTVPRVESLMASAVYRLTGRSECTSAADFEAVVAPIYGFHAGLAEGATGPALARGATVSRSVWSRATGNGRMSRFVVGRVTIPAAVAALNRLKIGPFSAVLTGHELRRAGLLAMARVADALAPDADNVLFGHTHRAGPLPGDDEAEWRTLAGARLWNTGNWYLESAFVKGRDERSPYWPGTVVWVEPGRPPRLENALRGYAAAGTSAGAGAASA